MAEATGAGSRAEWLGPELRAEEGWIVTLDEAAGQGLLAAVRAVHDPARPLLDYRRDEFALGTAGPPITAAFAEAKEGRGLALLRGLPRDGVTEDEFALMTWAIGLQHGVARPQGKASQYLSAVRDAGTVYRSAGGRGYSSNAELDFHTDGADLAILTCFNTARAGGMSMVSSSIAAHSLIVSERPDLADVLHTPFYFSRQAEQAPDEGPNYPNPIYDEADGLLFSKWNRNRMISAQKMEGVPALSAMQREAIDLLDATLRREAVIYAMHLRPGDMQIINNHVTLHSRTEFEDFDDPARKRLLFRLWLAPPDSVRLPESWRPAYRAVAPGSVRGGIIGQAHDDACRAFEARQAAALGMTTTAYVTVATRPAETPRSTHRPDPHRTPGADRPGS
jgi:hypothetical protein